VDAQTGELRKHGLRIKLQDQPFKVLVALLERPGEVLTRDELRQLIWGNDTFVDFNHGLSAAVNRLRDALSDSADSPRYVETVARRGYRFIAPVDGSPRPLAPEPIANPSPRRPVWAVVASVTTVAVLSVIGLWLMRARFLPPRPRLLQLTALTGSETMPAFSPDGRQIAFVWNSEKEDNAEIYVKLVGGETTLRLTNHPGADLLPSWSPDGRQIAFVRIDGKTGIYLVSPLGGPERKLAELPGVDLRPAGPETKVIGDLLYPIVSKPSWSADGKFLIIARNSEPPQPGDGAVLLIPVEAGDPRPILVPKKGTWYKQPAFSPDGRRLAVASCQGGPGGPQKCQIQIVPLSEQLQPQAAAQIILPDARQIRGIDWTPEGDALIVSGFSLPRFYAWRLSTSREAEPERLELAGADAMWPAVSRGSGRLAFARSFLQPDLWKLDAKGKQGPFLSSTARDTTPQFSPDGRSIAFESARGGSSHVWVAQADGAGLRQITSGPNQCGSPSWSPDGLWLAVDSVRDGQSDVWIVEASGGPLRQLTFGPGNSAVPNWSRDGKRIYFTSNRSGRSQIWRMPAAGGTAEQITREGGFLGFESMDGKSLYYTRTEDGAEGLFSLSLEGEEEKHLLTTQIVRRSFTVAPDGIYYITPRDSTICELRFHHFSIGRSRVVADIDRPVAAGLTVTPDRKTFLFARPVTGSDLMLIENFR